MEAGALCVCYTKITISCVFTLKITISCVFTLKITISCVFTLKIAISCVFYTENHYFLTETDDFIGRLSCETLVFFIEIAEMMHDSSLVD